MDQTPRTVLAVVAMACLSLLVPDRARAETEVDLALVLAVDVSRSMDPEEQELQRQGFIDAFRSPLVHDAIRNGMLGRITVTYFEWSSVDYQTVIVPWTNIDNPESAMKFAGELDRTEIGRIQCTSISGAIDFGVKLLGQTGVEPVRRVIDISGDGPNSSGRVLSRRRMKRPHKVSPSMVYRSCSSGPAALAIWRTSICTTGIVSSEDKGHFWCPSANVSSLPRQSGRRSFGRFPVFVLSPLSNQFRQTPR